MTAPAAPIIHTRQSGGLVRVAWRSVDGATDYNIYLDTEPNPEGIEDSVEDSEAQSNGWLVWWTTAVLDRVFVRVTALNALAEESGYSNQRYHAITSDADHMGMTLTQAARINRTF